MKIVGCDLHTRYRQIAMLDEDTGELVERRLEHASGEAREFYTNLSGPVRVGIEATGHTRWTSERDLRQLLWHRLRAMCMARHKPIASGQPPTANGQTPIANSQGPPANG